MSGLRNIYLLNALGSNIIYTAIVVSCAIILCVINFLPINIFIYENIENIYLYEN